MRLLCNGHGERFKAGYHAALATLLAGAALYNAGAFVARRRRDGRWEWHLARNAVLDTALTVWEITLVRHHRHAEPLTSRHDAVS